MFRTLNAAVVIAAAIGAVPTLAQQNRQDVCDTVYRQAEQRIKSSALNQERLLVEELARQGHAELLPPRRAAVSRNKFELSQAQQHHQDCMELP